MVINMYFDMWWLGIVLSIILMTICACLWKSDKNNGYHVLECGGWVAVTFGYCPIIGMIVTLIAYFILLTFGFWLVPIVLIVIGVLSFVYWDDLVEWFKDMKDGDE